VTAFNITDVLLDVAARKPDAPAVIYERRGKILLRLSFSELVSQVGRWAAGWRRAGLRPGERVILLARPDERFVPLMLGLIRAGGVVVLVDPGRAPAEFLECVTLVRPAGLVAPAGIQAASLLFPRAFGALRLRVCSSGRFPGAIPLADLARPPLTGRFSPLTQAEDEAALIFTTGSTGVPKGVPYTQARLFHQFQALRDSLALGENEIGLFGLSALMLLGLMAGVTAVIAGNLNAPPLRVKPAEFARQLQSYRATLTFASPALARRLAKTCLESGQNFPALRRLVVGGAPVDDRLITALKPLLPNGDTIVSLGATEVMPLAVIPGRQALVRAEGLEGLAAGVCCGFPAPRHELRIIPIREESVPLWSAALDLPPGSVGELVVRGPGVTSAYLARPELTALAKIQDGSGFWHRTGDLGWLDASGCLWYCGRKSQRVETGGQIFYTIPCEAVFNRHPSVERSALVGIGPRGSQLPVMVIQSAPGLDPRGRAARESLAVALAGLARSHPHTCSICRFAFYPSGFPVDIRHNSKIRREELANWARGALVYHSP
jgi:olefin beta-lactone synthetase